MTKFPTAIALALCTIAAACGAQEPARQIESSALSVVGAAGAAPPEGCVEMGRIRIDSEQKAAGHSEAGVTEVFFYEFSRQLDELEANYVIPSQDTELGEVVARGLPFDGAAYRCPTPGAA